MLHDGVMDEQKYHRKLQQWSWAIQQIVRYLHLFTDYLKEQNV